MISVILPVYNVENYLCECLESILKQTYRNIELIIVNDGSTDNSKNIIENFKHRYPNIILLEQTNKGLSEARNFGTKFATGEFIIYLDSDDYIERNMLELMYNKAKEINADAVICSHNEIYDDISKKLRKVKLNVKKNYSYTGQEVANLLLNLKIMGVTWNKLLKRELVIKNNLYFEPGRFTQDWYPIFKFISKCETIGIIREGLYNYRIRQGATTAKKNHKRLNDYTYAVSSIFAYINVYNKSLLKSNIRKFKVGTFAISISMFNDLMEDKNREIYKRFYDNQYLNFDLSVIDILVVTNVGIRMRLNLLLWKFKLFHLIQF